MNELVTFNEILAFTGLSHNSVSKKIKKLGILPMKKNGRTLLYSRNDMERINDYRPSPFNPKTVFYRVAVPAEYGWIVTHAGLTISKARKIVKDYLARGINARYIGCKA